MKLVAVSRVRNEADIIEAFVRHHAVLFDKLIVLDDGSCDGTYEALLLLQAEGLPLVVLRAPVIGYEQSRYMTRLLQMAVDQFGADWVAPLDADEFIELEDGTTLAEALSGQENRLLSMAWNNFEWRPEYENDPERNPVIRQRLRRPARPDQNKLLVPAGLVDETTQLLQGNHFLIRDGRQLTPRPIRSISLGHFPIRSVDQYACKIAVGYLQYVAMPNWNRNIGFHYIEPFKALLKGGLEALKNRMVLDSRRYSTADEIGPESIAAAHDEPLRYHGGLLKLAVPQPPLLQSLLHYVEAVACDRAGLLQRAGASVLESELEGSKIASVPPTQSISNSDELADEDPNQLPADRLKELRRQLNAVRTELERRSVDNDALEMRLARTEIKLLDAQQQLFLQLNSRTFKFVTRLKLWLRRAGLKPGPLVDWVSSLRRRRLF
jgi:glycosyltransferase involved in cell wall biosynthesis